jgi:6-pyruvoyltetrahydropterin/6-carboxytetrahydropterin synthase
MNHEGRCRYFHGHNYDVEAQFFGEETDNETGMLCDFSVLKKVVTDCVDKLDHAVILNVEDEDFISFMKCHSDRVVIIGNEPTCEEIGKFLFKQIATNVDKDDELMGKVLLARLELWETNKQSASIYLADIEDPIAEE